MSYVVNFETKALSCIICDTQDLDLHELTQHLRDSHKFKIVHIDKIYLLDKYLNYFRESLRNELSLKNKLWREEDQQYVLDNSLKEDQELRSNLKMEYLINLLNLQRKELLERTHVKCLFCREEYNQYGELLSHMFTNHNFNIGKPDNLVNIKHFVGQLQSKLEALRCIYCEKEFKTSAVLKEHMRKKKHYRINGANPTYHRYYLENYLEGEVENNNEELDSSLTEEEEDDWSEWDEDVGEASLCLFCDFEANLAKNVFIHMISAHKFDFHEIRSTENLNYYDCIKILNYIRHNIAQNQCPYCINEYSSKQELERHIVETNHCCIDFKSIIWNDAMFLRPVLENDALLMEFEEI